MFLFCFVVVKIDVMIFWVYDEEYVWVVFMLKDIIILFWK